MRAPGPEPAAASGRIPAGRPLTLRAIRPTADPSADPVRCTPRCVGCSRSPRRNGRFCVALASVIVGGELQDAMWCWCRPGCWARMCLFSWVLRCLRSRAPAVRLPAGRSVAPGGGPVTERVINGAFFNARAAGGPWRDLPEGQVDRLTFHWAAAPRSTGLTGQQPSRRPDTFSDGPRRRLCLVVAEFTLRIGTVTVSRARVTRRLVVQGIFCCSLCHEVRVKSPGLFIRGYANPSLGDSVLRMAAI